jgi:hypothetical protein
MTSRADYSSPGTTTDRKKSGSEGLTGLHLLFISQNPIDGRDTNTHLVGHLVLRVSYHYGAKI